MNVDERGISTASIAAPSAGAWLSEPCQARERLHALPWGRRDPKRVPDHAAATREWCQGRGTRGCASYSQRGFSRRCGSATKSSAESSPADAHGSGTGESERLAGEAGASCARGPVGERPHAAFCAGRGRGCQSRGIALSDAEAPMSRPRTILEAAIERRWQFVIPLQVAGLELSEIGAGLAARDGRLR
jgi:hypothetical protein